MLYLGTSRNCSEVYGQEPQVLGLSTAYGMPRAAGTLAVEGASRACGAILGIEAFFIKGLHGANSTWSISVFGSGGRRDAYGSAIIEQERLEERSYSVPVREPCRLMWNISPRYEGLTQTCIMSFS